MTIEPKPQSFWFRHRMLIMVGAVLLFLPPLAVVFQTTGDHNFCGTWCPRMFFVWRKGASLSSFFAGWGRAYMGVALVFVVLAISLRLGRFWCSHLCPVGGALELGSRAVPKRLSIDFSAVPAAPFRYGFLLVFMVAPAVGIGSLCCNYCNFAALPRLFGAAFTEADLTYFLRIQGGINLALLLGLGFFAKGGRGYCNLLCPIGAIDALVNRIGLGSGRRVRIDHEHCIDCKDCIGACPTWAITSSSKPVIDQLSCMPCGQCETVCPTGAISYGTPKT